MNKKTITLAASVIAAIPALAGGFNTNTQQTAAFLRMPAQVAVISVDGAYFNPAGVAFMKPGLYLGANWESAFQTRQDEVTYQPYEYNVNFQGEDTRKYKGRATAPFIPSFDIAYVWDRWAVSAHMGITAGGGKLRYKDGLGSFESKFASAAALLNEMGLSNTLYNLNMTLTGSSYYYSGQVSAAYKINDKLSVSLGGRLTYAINAYDAMVSDIEFTTNGVNTVTVLQNLAANTTDATKAATYSYYAAAMQQASQNIVLDVEQTDFGFNPIIGIDFKSGKWNVAARYEFRTIFQLNNETQQNTTGLSQYDDGLKMRSDIPGFLSVGAGYEATDRFRVYAQGNMYFDKNAKQYGGREEYLDGNCWEAIAGAEYDLNNWLTLSCGVQETEFGFGDAKNYISDMSFSAPSTSALVGAKFKLSDDLSIDFGMMKTFYRHLEKDSMQADIMGDGTRAYHDNFFRTNFVLGAGVKIAL
ncbi:MAG: hypothetical protein K5984_02620 [Bacteroidales bacterium]|nr:hypothetical protein [Bacteroidales bacterium]